MLLPHCGLGNRGVACQLGVLTTVVCLVGGCDRDRPASDPSVTGPNSSAIAGDVRPVAPSTRISTASSVTGYQLVSKPDSTNGLEFTAGVLCPSGTQALGGGVRNDNYGWWVESSYPNSPGIGWYYTVATNQNPGGYVHFIGWVVCA